RWARTRLFRGAGKALASGSGRWPSPGAGFVQFLSFARESGFPLQRQGLFAGRGIQSDFDRKLLSRSRGSGRNSYALPEQGQRAKEHAKASHASLIIRGQQKRLPKRIIQFQLQSRVLVWVINDPLPEFCKKSSFLEKISHGVRHGGHGAPYTIAGFVANGVLP